MAAEALFLMQFSASLFIPAIAWFEEMVSSLQCPRLHGHLDPVILNSELQSSLRAYLCTECHGVWLPALEAQSYLGLECEKLVRSAFTASIALECPYCQTPFKLRTLEYESGFSVDIHICPRCFSCFLDGTQYALVFHNQMRAERAVSGILAQSPLDSIGVVCCDCGAIVNNLDELYDAGIGYCCQKCQNTPPILSADNKIQNVQLVTFRNMEIKLDHWQASTTSRISVTPEEPCLLDVRLFSLSNWNRFARMGYRKLKLHSKLRRHIEATEGIEHITPWHIFLKQRGVTNCLEQLVDLGQISLTFKPHSIVFEVDLERMGTDTRMRFEVIVRRLLIAYERFVSLMHRYSYPDDTETIAEAPQTDSADPA